MPAVIPPAGSGGLPRISTRAFQLIDQGSSVWSAFWTAINEWLQALVAFYGREAAIVVNRIGF